MNYYIYAVSELDLSNIQHVASKDTAESAIAHAQKLLNQWRQVGRVPYRYVVRYNPTNALIASVP
jgi:hypothetical protein